MRYAIGIEYDGTEFFGWQRHNSGATVQATVEEALSFVANDTVEVVCGGRTDAGVHALCQVAHFDSNVERTSRAWVMGANTKLPPSVRIVWCVPVSDEFNARFSARARAYRYSIWNHDIRPALFRHVYSWDYRKFDADRMHRAAQCLIGEHDFSAFRTAQCEAKHPNRNLHRISVTREGDALHVDIQANAFLHHMVRNIVGSLMEIGCGAQSENWMQELLDGKDRTKAGPTAPAAGLVFLGPRYPQRWGLPDNVSLPDRYDTAGFGIPEE
jgi:tRNA pseudouridine38-40 synthase